MKFHQILVDFGMLQQEKKMDKDRFRRDMGNVINGYREVLNRLKG